VQREVLFATLKLALAGTVLGIVASVGTARLIATLLFATSPWDADTYLGMSFALITVALISGYPPARRASRISPMSALRNN
jgi:ABC-type antimicrobial peptide transport system permease subunit